MADRVAIFLDKTRVNEGSQFVVQVYVRDGADAVAPTTLEWQLYNLTRNLIVKDWQSLTAASSASFSVSALLNTIRRGRATERYELRVAADRQLATRVIGTRHYVVFDAPGYSGDFSKYLLDESGEAVLEEGGELING